MNEQRYHAGRTLLDYGRQDLRLRRVVRRLCVVIAVLLLLGGALRVATPSVLRIRDQLAVQPRRKALYERCMNHTYPPRTLVFDEAMDTLNIPMYSDPYLPSPPRPGAHSVPEQRTFIGYQLFWPAPPNASQTADWLDLADLNFRYYSPWGSVKCAHNCRPTKSYTQNDAYYGGSDELFRHSRRSRDGNVQLVLIGFDPPAFMAGSILPFRSQVVTMHGQFQSLEYSGQWELNLLFNCPPTQPLKLYAGQADPSDESHFTIDYSTPAGEGVIDGWLVSHNFVNLRIRNGPATENW
ncbi:MAG TPA: hypothetical protein VH370_18420 [Humisphaera sp.]|jgi:hypothetical protein|nr:hypothetical protein [Humisphaera sp.]